MATTKNKSQSKATPKAKNPLASAAKAPKEEAPLKVAIVPPGEAGLTDQQKAEMKESNAPENVENRNKSYEPPNLVVNQNTGE